MALDCHSHFSFLILFRYGSLFRSYRAPELNRTSQAVRDSGRVKIALRFIAGTRSVLCPKSASRTTEYQPSAVRTLYQWDTSTPPMNRWAISIRPLLRTEGDGYGDAHGAD